MGKRQNINNDDVTPKQALVLLCFFVFFFLIFYISDVWRNCIWEWPLRIFDQTCYEEQKDTATKKAIENMPGKKTIKNITR